jgi:type IV pilus assembly protein PilM
MRVVLVAVKRTTIEEHVAMLDRLGLSPAIIDHDGFAVANAFEMRCKALGTDDDVTRGLVDVGAQKTNIVIMKGARLQFSRQFYVAGNDLTEVVARRFDEDPADIERMKLEPGGALRTMQDAMESVLEDMCNEIRLSFDYYDNQFEEKVTEVYLSGGSVMFPEFQKMMGGVLGLKCELWDPMETLEISGPKFDAGRLSGMNSDTAVAVGLASRVLGR